MPGSLEVLGQEMREHLFYAAVMQVMERRLRVPIQHRS